MLGSTALTLVGAVLVLVSTALALALTSWCGLVTIFLDTYNQQKDMSK
jgi:hypothetical protein